MFDTVITITANNRPDYLRTVIKSWRAARGIDEVPVHFQVEPVSIEVDRICEAAPFGMRSSQVNEDQLGALSNPHAALKTAFDNYGAEFAILGEDDSVVTADILEYFKWARDTFAHDPSVIAVCSFQHKPLGPPDLAMHRDYFASVIWGTWRDRWVEWMDAKWGHNYVEGEWDFRFCNMCAQGDYTCVFPMLSRSQHIGKFGGTHHDPDKYDRLRAQAVHDGSPVDWRMR